MPDLITIIEDDESIREMLRYYFHSVGYGVEDFESGEDYFQAVHDVQPDLYILDIMLPGMDGLEILRRLRGAPDTAHIPVIMLTARTAELDRVKGLEQGADDYVVKPFSPRELMMRVNVILQRNGKKDAGVRRVTFTHQGLTIDFTARTVQVDGETVELSPKTYDLLFYLVKNRGIALTREQLISNVWGYDFFGDDRTLDTHIKLLRSSLGKYRDLIVTLRGVGYRFEA